MYCLINVLICITLGSLYVGSLYVWSNNSALGRNHPFTIKRRSISVLCMTVLSAFIVYFCLDSVYFKDYEYWRVIGIHYEGLIQAVVIPLFLTVVLFSGPLVMYYLDDVYQRSFDIRFCIYNFQDLAWIRNYIVAPFSEEFTFRACMLPVLVPCFGIVSVFICPLFFGIAHLHHLREKLDRGTPLKIAVLNSLFQLSYTTAFGVYSSYLFLRTGHFISSFIAHVFCNYMGFPDFPGVLSSDPPRKIALSIIFVCGLISWLYLLVPLTNPTLYHNKLYSTV